MNVPAKTTMIIPANNIAVTAPPLRPLGLSEDEEEEDGETEELGLFVGDLLGGGTRQAPSSRTSPGVLHMQISFPIVPADP